MDAWAGGAAIAPEPDCDGTLILIGGSIGDAQADEQHKGQKENEKIETMGRHADGAHRHPRDAPMA